MSERPDLYEEINRLDEDIVIIHTAFALLSERLGLDKDFWERVRIVYEAELANRKNKTEEQKEETTNGDLSA